MNRGFARLFPSGKYLGFSLVAMALSLALSLAAAEILMRWLGMPFTDEQPTVEFPIAQFDPLLGWSYIPNLAASRAFGADQRVVQMYFDQHGARVARLGARHDEAALSILFVGCSYTMGHALTHEESLPGIVESLPGMPYQVINLGAQGYGTDQAYLRLMQSLQRFAHTRAVIHIYAPGIHNERNTVHDMRVLARHSRQIGTKPAFRLQGGRLSQRHYPRRIEDYGYWRIGAALEIVWRRWGPRPDSSLALALLSKMREATEAAGAKFVVVYWGVDPPYELEALRLNFIDVNSASPLKNTGWRIPGDGHPNAEMMKKVASPLRAELLRLGIAPGNDEPARAVR